MRDRQGKLWTAVQRPNGNMVLLPSNKNDTVHPLLPTSVPNSLYPVIMPTEERK